MTFLGEPAPGASPIEVATSSTAVVETKSNVEEVKRELIDPRTISRKIDPEGRTDAASAVLEARAETQTTQKKRSGIEQKIQQLAELTSASHRQEMQRAQELTQRLESLVVRVKSLVGISDERANGLQAEIDAIKTERERLYSQSFGIGHELEDLKQQQADIPSPAQLLETYYEKISTRPLSNEQKRALLKPEVLASLTYEEYVALWKRLNPYFLAHVTRQGFRDHNGMFWHSAGMEEFHNGFLAIIEDDKKLRPPIVVNGLRTRDETSVKNYLGGWVLQAENEDEARSRLHHMLGSFSGKAPGYPDKTAVHLAAQLVADSYYGGETNNEVFFIYPSDFLASQYAFAFYGKEKDFTQRQSETKWNDVFVWPQVLDNPGIPIDSGMVFLPENTPVDPQTGSKYASEVKVIDGQEKRVMIEDSKLVSSFVEWGKGLNEQSPLRQAFSDYKGERGFREQEMEETCLTSFSQELQRLGFAPDASVLLGRRMMSEMHSGTDFNDEVLETMVRETGANWKMAESTVPAKQYWNEFFTRNPNLRPKHIQYYDGLPTSAVYEFLQANNIGRADTSKTDGSLLGFDDHRVKNMENDPRSNVNYKELVATANKIITEHFNSTTQDASGAKMV